MYVLLPVRGRDVRSTVVVGIEAIRITEYVISDPSHPVTTLFTKKGHARSENATQIAGKSLKVFRISRAAFDPVTSTTKKNAWEQKENI
jgi:hypothetical protein